MAAVLPVMALVGCGGGDASWAQRADEICDRTERAVRAVEPPEDVDGLGRAMVRVSGEVRTAVGEIRALDVPADQERRARPFLADLAVVEGHLDRIAALARAGKGMPIEREGRALRLDGIDFAAHAQQAGLTRCGREELGIAAGAAVVVPPFAARIAELHRAFLASAWDVPRPGPARDRHWIAVWDAIQQLDRDITAGEVPETKLAEVDRYFDAWTELGRLVDFLQLQAKGKIAADDRRVTVRDALTELDHFTRAGMTLLRQLGPAGRAQLRMLRGSGDGDPAPRRQIS